MKHLQKVLGILGWGLLGATAVVVVASCVMDIPFAVTRNPFFVNGAIVIACVLIRARSQAETEARRERSLERYNRLETFLTKRGMPWGRRLGIGLIASAFLVMAFAFFSSNDSIFGVALPLYLLGFPLSLLSAHPTKSILAAEDRSEESPTADH